MAMNHAPGPWHVAGESRAARYITVKAANGRTVARVPFSTEAEGEAGTATDYDDAKLIGAAPDLFSILKTLTDCMPVGGGMVRFDGEVLARARAAIAKAEGR